MQNMEILYLMGGQKNTAGQISPTWMSLGSINIDWISPRPILDQISSKPMSLGYTNLDQSSPTPTSPFSMYSDQISPMSSHPEVVETDNGDKIIDFKERIKSGNDDIPSQISKLDLSSWKID